MHRQVEIDTAEPVLLELIFFFEVEIVIGMLKNYASPGINQIVAKLIQARGETLQSEIHKTINSIWNKEELP